MKRTLSFLLSVVMTVTFLCSSVTVYAEETPPDTMPKIENNVSISGTNSFGNLLSEALTEESDRQEENNGYNVFSAEVTGNIVTVEYETLEDCTLLAAVYDEEGKTLLTSGKAEVSKDETLSEVTIETDAMPEYFYLRVFMIDSDDLSPMCTVYESPNYTKEMQEFFAKTVDDFDADKVLNLDNDKTNNFAVYNDGVKTITSDGTVNVFTTIDEENEHYIIENADDSVKSLEKDDIFVYEYDDGCLLIVDVGTISVDGTTVTITGQDTSMEEVFDYVKIDSTKTPTPEPQAMPSPLSANKKSIDIDASNTIYWPTVNLGKPDIFDKFFAGIKGTLQLSATVNVKIYFTLEYQYISLKLDFNAEIKASIGANGTLADISLDTFQAPLPYGLKIEIECKFGVEASGAMELANTFSFSIGCSYDSDTKKLKNLSTAPELNAEHRVEGAIFMYFAAAPQIVFVNDKLVYAELAFKTGIETSGKLLLWESDPNDDTKHLCKNCIKGQKAQKTENEISLQVFNNINLAKQKLNESIIKTQDFYYSIDNLEFGYGTCPYISYKVPVYVRDDSGSPLADADVKIDSTLYGKTDSDGYICLYLSNGTYNINAIKDGATNSRKITVHNEAKNNINITLDIAKPSVDDWKKIYADLLKNYSNEYAFEPMFDLYDMNGDNIPELFISPNTAHASGVYIYTIYNSKLIAFNESFGECGECLYSESKKNILSSYFSSGRSHRSYYVLINGNIECVLTAFSNAADVGLENATYKINDENVSYEKYTEELSKFDSNDYIKVGRRYNLDEDTIDSILSAFNTTTVLIPTYEGDIIESGNCGAKGDNVKYELYDNGTLRIFGEGDMKSLYDKGDSFSENTKINNAVIEYGVTNISGYAFGGCKNLKSIIIPDSVKLISWQAFQDCSSLESITIPYGVTNIYQYAFKDCLNLKSITIPNSVTDIRLSAFEGCSSLESITIPSSVISIGEYAFRECSSLKCVTILDSIINISEGTFSYCSNLESITIPNSVTSIGESAFQYCKNLTSIIIPDSIKSIGECAFEGCSSLESITIPNGITSIEKHTFYGCPSLKSITIPNSVTKIGYQAFENYYTLKYVYYTGTEEEWEKIFINSDNKWISKVQYNSTGTETLSLSPPAISINAPEKANPLENLSPETIYNVYVFRSKAAEKLLSAKNLLYVMQFRTDSSGNIDAPDMPDGEVSVVRTKRDVLLGDANCDGEVNIADATAIVQAIGNKDRYALSELGEINADCYNTGDGVTGMDAMVIQKIEAGLYSVADLPVRA